MNHLNVHSVGASLFAVHRGGLTRAEGGIGIFFSSGMADHALRLGPYM